MMKKLLFISTFLFAGLLNAQTYNFTTAGITGRFGPTQTDINTAYAATNLNGMVTVTTQGIQEWVVPSTGNYLIQAVGASGGNSTYGTIRPGGNGADMSGEFNLVAGQTLYILVGQTGESAAVGGGGGGTYVVLSGSPLIVAGGGGGASSDQNGVGAVTTQDGTYCSMNVISGGIGGNGGNACMTSQNNGGGGGGFNTDGQTPNVGGLDNNGFGGLSFLNGGIGGQPGRLDGACTGDAYGGFGGGGSTTCNTVGGGGGGGYSGGAGGQHYGNCGGGSIRAGGGGGGSYNSGTNPVNVANANNGAGYVVITSLCTPSSVTPDMATLPDITEECSAAAPVAPTASTNCGGSVTGTTTATFPITTPGTTVITWDFDDGNGNTATQTQNVIINDVTSPVPDSTSLPEFSDCAQVTLTAPTATDNCSGSLTGTPDVTFPVTAPGLTVVTWTFTDGNGNTSTQTQNVTINAIDVTVNQNGSQLNAVELVAAYQWLDCDNNYAIVPGAMNQFFTPPSTGYYAVEITKNGCVDTSACYLVDFTALNELGNELLSLYPNPVAGGIVHINYSGTVESISVYDLTGREVIRVYDASSFEVSELLSGSYLTVIVTDKGTAIREFIKN